MKVKKYIQIYLHGHKGPIYFLIEYIGTSMPFSNYLGLWLIEVCFMIVTLIYLFKTANLISKNKLISSIALFIAILPFTLYFINGNYPEEYCLPFTAISLYYMTAYLIGKKTLEKKQCILIGVCAATAFMIKLNLISVWIVFCSVIIIKMAMQKEWKKIRDTFLYFLIGVSIVFIPTIIVLLIQGNFQDFINEYIIFNFKYSKMSTGVADNAKNLFLINIFYLSCIVCVIDIIIKIIKKQKGKLLSFTALLYLLITLGIILIPHNDYWHYGIPSIPTYVIPMALLLTDFIDILYVKENIFKIFLTVIIFIGFGYHFTKGDIIKYKENVTTESTKKYFEFKEKYLINYIKNSTSKDDKILVLGNDCNIYLLAERSTDCKYFYQVPIMQIDPTIGDNTLEEIDKKKPKLIITANIYQDFVERFKEHVKENNSYHLVYVYNTFEVYRLND